ncbi:MAG TPA: hypothetical protein DCP28_14775 [Cytophagales bacterium]|nr:hypothetical protein [Cytophagales bacterium]
MDSLEAVIATLDASTERVDAMLAWTNLFYRSDAQGAVVRVEAAYEEAEVLDYTLGMAEALRLRGMVYTYQGDYNEALIQYDRALELFSLEGDSLGSGKVFNNFGAFYYNQGNLITAQRYYEKAASYLMLQKVPNELGKVYNNMGIVMRRQFNYQKALEYYQKALSLQQSVNDLSAVAGIYNNLGVIYRNLNDNVTAREYYQKALEIKIELNELAGIGNGYNNIGLLYMLEREFDLALVAFEESLAIKADLGDPQEEATVLQNIGDLYLRQNRYDLAEEYLSTARSIFQENNNATAVAAADIYLAEALMFTDRLDRAEAMLVDALDIVRAEKDYNLQVEALKTSISLDSLRQDVSSVFMHVYELGVIQDSLFSTQRAQELAAQQSLLQLDESERLNQRLIDETNNQARRLETEQETNLILRNWNAFILLGLTLMVGLVIMLRRQQRQNLQYNRQLEQKNEEISTQAENLVLANQQIIDKTEVIEQKNRDITDSINYASQIQRAMLPMNVTLQAYLPEHFIFYQPKDIVSGDFYWFHQADGYLFLAVIDCTGHGVPGAFMSTLGQQALLTAVVQQKLREPAEILDALKVIIRQMLHQDKTQNQDGMDISLTVINPKQNQLKFAGAKHSLLYLCNGTLNLIKGDRMSVGGEHWAIEDRFSQYTVELEKGMTIYMTTDGYKDQFGGPDNKKFLPKRFHTMLREIHELPMQEQQFRVEQTIRHWMKEGDNEQVDDILVWGVRWEG